MAIASSGATGAATTGWFGEARATSALAWPMILTNLGQTAMTTTDVALMGRLGPEVLAAGTLGTSIYFTPMIFGMGLIIATSPMVATALGRNRHSVRDVRRTVRQGLWLALIAVIPLWLFLWFGAEKALLALGQQPELAKIAAGYVRALQWAALPFYWYIVLRSFVSALERPGWALAVVGVTVVFNAVAAWSLMFGRLGMPNLGIVGAGVATTLASTMMFGGLALVLVTERRFRRYRIFGRFWRADWQRLMSLARLGLPIGAILVFEVSLFNAAAFLMGLIDAVSLAAHAIALQIASVSFMVPMGLGQAATVRVGRAYGAGDAEGVARAGWTAFAMGVGFMGLMALVMVTFPRVLIAGFVDLDDPANRLVVQTAVTFLAFAGLFQVVDGAQAVASGMLRGLHDTAMPMLFAAIGYWGVGMPLSALLAFRFGLGGNGIWIGLCAGLLVVAVLLTTRWIRRGRLFSKAAPASGAAFH
jgi:MATE family multidrug resistance protein